MSWIRVPLERVTKISGGSTPRRDNPEYWGGDILWVTPTDLPMPGDGIAHVADTADKITEAGLRAIGGQLVPPGTVLFSSRATIGKIGIAEAPLATNQGFANFTPLPLLDSQYLAYALQFFTNEIAALAGSITFKEVTRTAIRRFEIPLPPPSEQHRIVELLQKADGLRRRRAEADAIAGRVLPALFYEMFGDPLTNPMGWPKARLGEVCQIFSGATPQTDVPEYWDGSILWATPKDLSDLDDFVLYGTERRITEAGLDSCSTVVLPEGTVLLSSRAPIGLVAIAGAPMCTNQGFKSLVCSERLNSWYVFGWVKLSTAYLNALGRGATFKEISKAVVESIEIPIPRMEVQTKFATRLRLLRSTHVHQHKCRENIERLFDVLVYRAFAGDLTAKWRDAHIRDLLAEMEHQAKLLNVPREALLC